MSRFKRLSHTIWHCQYHIVWCPKYRFRILKGPVQVEVSACIGQYTREQSCEVVELNVQMDHVHLLAMVPPKISISNFVGKIKGKTAIRMFSRFRELRQKPYWGNSFWAQGYCVDTVGLDEEKIRKYVKYQEQNEIRRSHR